MAKGDRKVFDGVEYESLGDSGEVATRNPKAAPAMRRENQFWVPPQKKPEGFLAMKKGGKVRRK